MRDKLFYTEGSKCLETCTILTGQNKPDAERCGPCRCWNLVQKNGCWKNSTGIDEGNVARSIFPMTGESTSREHSTAPVYSMPFRTEVNWKFVNLGNGLPQKAVEAKPSQIYI